MEYFLDDPNDNVDSKERNFAKTIHLLGFVGSILPPLNFILPYVVCKTNKNSTSFTNRNISNALNLQSFILLLTTVAIGLYFILNLFYVLLFILFIVLFQCIYTYNNYIAAKNGYDYKFPFITKLF